MGKIAVLIHEMAPDPGTYLLGLLMDEWRHMGLDVQVVRGVSHYVEADLLIPHLDLTLVPDEYREFMQRYPRSINASVVDISKSKVSVNLVGPDSPYRGPVIVKTDRNFGGIPEARLRTHGGVAAQGATANAGTAKVGSALPDPTAWRQVRELKTSEYVVFPSIAAVPADVFGNSNLVVEKFCPERRDDNYAVRYYWFCGDREISYRLSSPQPVIKVSNAVDIEQVPIPPELREMRKGLGFDFGKFDYVMHDGVPTLFDANRTPGGSFMKHGHCQSLHTIARDLSAGIWPLLQKSATHPAKGMNVSPA